MFDPSAPHIIILLVVVLLLFGSTRLPGAAKALGSSMNIFKKSLKDGGEDEHASIQKASQATVLPPAPPQQAAQDSATAQQLLDLQRQVQDLQRKQESPSTQQPL